MFNMESAVAELSAKVGNLGVYDPTSDEFYTVLDQRLQRVEEEVAEMRKGVNERDPKEILDGIIDILVTAYGLKQVVSGAGYNVESAELAIAANNLSKVTLDAAFAFESAKAYTGADEAYVRATDYNGQVWYSVIRKSDGKFMKLLGHQKVDLNNYIPLAVHRDDPSQHIKFSEVNNGYVG